MRAASAIMVRCARLWFWRWPVPDGGRGRRRLCSNSTLPSELGPRGEVGQINGNSRPARAQIASLRWRFSWRRPRQVPSRAAAILSSDASIARNHGSTRVARVQRDVFGWCRACRWHVVGKIDLEAPESVATAGRLRHRYWPVASPRPSSLRHSKRPRGPAVGHLISRRSRYEGCARAWATSH